MAKTQRVSGAPAGSSFTKPDKAPAAPEFDPTRPGAFDIAGFLAGATQHTNVRVLRVTSKPDVAAALELAMTEADLLRSAQAEPEDAPRRRLSQASGGTERLKELDATIAELAPQLDGTWLEVKLRGLTPSEQDTIRMQRPPTGVELAAAIFAVTATVRTPGEDEGPWASLTAAQWADLIEAIGPAQYSTLDKAHESLTYQAVTPDFYERFSASRATGSTSAS